MRIQDVVESDENLAFAKVLKEQGVSHKEIKKELTLRGLEKKYVRAVMANLEHKAKPINNKSTQKKNSSEGIGFFKVLKWIFIIIKLGILIGIITR